MARIEKSHTGAAWRVLEQLPDGKFEQHGPTVPTAEKARSQAKKLAEPGKTFITAKMTYSVTIE